MRHCIFVSALLYLLMNRLGRTTPPWRVLVVFFFEGMRSIMCPLEDVLRTFSFWQNFDSTSPLEGVDYVPEEVYYFIVSSGGCIARVAIPEECGEPENAWWVLVPFSSTGLCNITSSGGCSACFFLLEYFCGPTKSPEGVVLSYPW